MVARLVLVSALSALIPMTYLLSSIQEAAAFSSASDSTLPGSLTYCTTFTFPISALDVTVNNSNTKLVLATLGGDTELDGQTDVMNLILELPGGSIVDVQNIIDEVNENAALSWTGNPTGQYEVRFSSNTGDGVCLTELDSDLRIICTTPPKCDGT